MADNEKTPEEDPNATTTEYVPADNPEYPGNQIVDTNAGKDAKDGGVASVDLDEVASSE